MKQENRFVAQLYGYLAPFVNADARVHLALDGEAAKRGVTEKLFHDPNVPDMWFTLVDGRTLHLEAKLMSWKNGFSVGTAQLRAWLDPGNGKHKPTGWVLAREDRDDAFYYWPHKTIATCAVLKHQPKYWKIEAPTMEPVFSSVRELALHILRTA